MRKCLLIESNFRQFYLFLNCIHQSASLELRVRSKDKRSCSTSNQKVKLINSSIETVHLFHSQSINSDQQTENGNMKLILKIDFKLTSLIYFKIKDCTIIHQKNSSLFNKNDFHSIIHLSIEMKNKEKNFQEKKIFFSPISISTVILALYRISVCI